MMEKFTQYGTSVVVAHTGIVALHALSHEVLLVSLSLFQSLFVGIVIILTLSLQPFCFGLAPLA
ncbi:MAG: hypothetical protein MJA27_36060 [Pseudanabaenales cyanobacterium]|nr:hypothetical protein [Pseudanabaenales cyanobacterium]